MTMYLGNGDVRPTGYEPGEFLEAPAVALPVEPDATASEADSDDVEPATHE